jgi:hypothetical protein
MPFVKAKGEHCHHVGQPVACEFDPEWRRNSVQVCQASITMFFWAGRFWVTFVKVPETSGWSEWGTERRNTKYHLPTSRS